MGRVDRMGQGVGNLRNSARNEPVRKECRPAGAIKDGEVDDTLRGHLRNANAFLSDGGAAE